MAHGDAARGARIVDDRRHFCASVFFFRARARRRAQKQNKTNGARHAGNGNGSSIKCRWRTFSKHNILHGFTAAAAAAAGNPCWPRTPFGFFGWFFMGAWRMVGEEGRAQRAVSPPSIFMARTHRAQRAA